MTAVSHAADYVAVQMGAATNASGLGPVPTNAGASSGPHPRLVNAAAATAEGSDDAATKPAHLRLPAVAARLPAATLLRHRFLAVGVAIVVCTLVYMEVHVVGAQLWDVVATAPKGSFGSPARIIELAGRVKAVAEGRLWSVTALIGTVYLLLQTLCIPGTIALNAVFGALLGVAAGLPLCVLLGTLGATCCFGLSSLAGARLAAAVDARLMNSQGIPKLRSQVNKNRGDLLAYLLFLRLTPILPNWLINLASPVVQVPLKHFVVATLIGITPQTYLAVRFGSIAQATSASSLVTWYDTLAIAGIGVLVLLVSRLKKRFAAAAPPS